MAATVDPKLLTTMITAGAAISAALLSSAFTQYKTAQRAREEKQQEKANITRALLIEVHLVNEAISKRIQWWNGVDPKSWLPPLIEIAAPTFDKLRERIGLVDRDIGQEIVEFHGYIHFINSLQQAKADYEHHKLGEQFYLQYKNVLEDHLKIRGDAAFKGFFDRFDLRWPEKTLAQAQSSGRA